MERANIGFIGLGKLGMPCAEVISQKGHDVVGYDKKRVQSDSVKIVLSIEEVCKESDIVFVAVPTPHDELYDGKLPTSHLEPRDFDYKIVTDVIAECDKHMTRVLYH